MNGRNTERASTVLRCKDTDERRLVDIIIEKKKKKSWAAATQSKASPFGGHYNLCTSPIPAPNCAR